MPSSSPPSSSPVAALLWLLALVPMPSVGVYLAMWPASTAGTPVGQGVYAAAKLWILLVPAVWWLRHRRRADRSGIDRGIASEAPPRRRGLVVGLLSGLLIAAVILGAFTMFGEAWIDLATVRAAAERAGIAEPWRYLALAVYLCLVNALLEEYVWRWFVFRRCEDVLVARGAAMRAVAVVLSAVVFTAHHVIALAAQFDWRITALGSLGVFIGGVAWSWLFLHFRTIWPGYLSHVIVDAAIFIIGWRLIFV